MESRFAMFWARVLVCVGMLLVALGVISAATVLVLDMPWGKLTGQAVVERMLAMVVLTVAGLIAGAPTIVMGEMLRVLLDQRQLLGEIKLVSGKRRGEGEA